LSQLWHVGSFRHPDFDSKNLVPSVAPSALPHPGMVAPGRPHIPKELSHADIQELIETYVHSATYAEKIGFDGIEIHAAHGYLIDQFFWQQTNKRTDEFGGPLKNRVKFAVKVIQAIRSQVSPSFVISLRFSQWKLEQFQEKLTHTPSELETLLLPLAKAGVDLFHASTYRFYEPAFSDSPLTLAGWTKKITGKPTMAVGGVGLTTDFRQEKQGDLANKEINTQVLEEKIQAEEFDLIALGRALLGDPQWVNKLQQGKTDEIRCYDKKDLAHLQ